MKARKNTPILTFYAIIGFVILNSNVVFGSPQEQVVYDLKITSVAQSFTSFTLTSNNSTLNVSASGLTVNGTMAHPPAAQISNLAMTVGSKKWLIVKMSSSTGPYGGFYFKTSTGETQYFTFPIISDGKLRTYNVYLGNEIILNKPHIADSKFLGTIALFAIIPSYQNNASGLIESVEFSDTNKSSGFLIPEYAGAYHSLYRVGRPAPIAVRVRNGGGIALTGITVKFETDDQLKIYTSFRDIPVSLAPDKPATFYADVLSQTVGRKNFRIIVTASNGDTIIIPGNLDIESALANVQGSGSFVSGQIPVPKPLSIPNYDIGMYYFSGWSSLTHWPSIVPYAERRPELGYYDEGNRDAANWTIKWAVEHGVEFMDILLYWPNHGPENEEFLNLGLMQASFLPYIKFFVTWSNDWGTPNETDFVNFYKYVIDNYCGSPSYKKCEDGRPMVGILSPSIMAVALGGMSVLENLKTQVNAYAVSKGYLGLFWVGGNKSNTVNGFEGFRWYNYPSGGNKYPCSNASYLIAGQSSMWGGLYDPNCPTCVTLLPASTGFNHRPWDGKMSWSLRYNFTPALFEQNLRDAKSFIDPKGQKTIIIESWNEWGEGSSLGPHGLFGFSLLDVIPKVFAPDSAVRPHVVPRDVNVYAPEIAGLWNVAGIKKPDFGAVLPEDFSTNLKDIKDNSTIRHIFPNGNSGIFTLSYTSSGKGKVMVRVLTLNSTVVKTLSYTKTENTFETEINIPEIKSGIYLIEVQEDGVRVFCDKIIINCL